LAQDGDSAAFETLYRLHNRRVYAVCLRMVGNISEAEDLTQDAFLMVFRKIQSFRGESAFSTWLHQVTVNTVLMRFRKKNLAQDSFDEASDPDEDDLAPPAQFGEEDLRLRGVIDGVILQRAIERLSPGCKEIFLLHDVEGYLHTEIAEIEGCSVGNSKSQLHKARTRLRETLHDECRSGGKRRGRTAAVRERAPEPEVSHQGGPQGIALNPEFTFADALAV
jgi:RNA polymerase sigma-70 factor (ECF subfamily)